MLIELKLNGGTVGYFIATEIAAITRADIGTYVFLKGINGEFLTEENIETVKNKLLQALKDRCL